MTIALNAPADFFGEELTKAEPLHIGEVIPVLSGQAEVNVPEDTLMYIFNYSGERGYTVISSDTRTGDVLAIVKEGSFNVADTAENSLKKYLLECMIGYQKHKLDSLAKEDADTKGSAGNNPPTKEYAGYMRNYRGNTSVVNTVSRNFQNYNFNVKYPEPYEATIYGDSYYLSKGCIGQWNFTQTTTVVSPLIKTEWGQTSPYNNSAPYVHPDGSINDDNTTPDDQRAVAGCVSVAVAQIMAYHAWPKTYPANVGSRYGGPTCIDDFKGLVNSSQIKTEADKNKISHFFRVIGDLLGNNWGISGTSASEAAIPGCFAKMGYVRPEPPKPYNIYQIVESLKLKRPVLIYGYDGIDSAHEWILDGYKKKEVGYDYFYFDENAKFTKNKFQKWIPESEQNYLSCNFGWDGSQDGYYLDKLFITNYYSFTYSLSIITNIYK